MTTTLWMLVAALGVKDDATDAQIKKAYRKLSLQYHPGEMFLLCGSLPT
jgi:curved DNA-binding protein CbpA